MHLAALGLGVAFVSSFLLLSEGCTCFPSHPQQYFCNADYVIRVRPLSVVEPNSQVDPRIYTVKVLDTFKGECYKGKIIKLYTGANSALCGAYLDVEQKPSYLISGNIVDGKRRFISCGWVEQWDTMDDCKKQRLSGKYFGILHYLLNKDFQMTSDLYKDNCGCEVCYNECEKSKKGCSMEGKPFERINDICAKNQFGYTRECSWVKCGGRKTTHLK